MENKRLKELRIRIDELPKGNITTKNIRGRLRLYLQWREDGKQKNRYVKAADEEQVRSQIEERLRLEKEYEMLMHLSLNSDLKEDDDMNQRFYTNITLGKNLEMACSKVKKFKPRSCVSILKKYLVSDLPGRVCLVFGLRRTGKTTMIFQAIAELPVEKTAYIKVMKSDTMAGLNKDLKRLSDMGIEYIFIDEVTLLEDFIDGASLFSDVYAMYGIKLVLSGTDSLGFAISAQEELYDRTVMIHTTFIPFREYSRLLGIHDIDEYIRYGGTFRIGETDFDNPELMDEGVSFRDDESTRRYIDTAIARNIQHSLACYNDGSHFRHLQELYEAGELTNAINRIIEDMNHRFLLSVITKDFKSHDLGSAAQITRKQAMLEGRKNILDEIDEGIVTARLMDILDIKNKEGLTVEITKAHVAEIREYLELLELIMDIPSNGMETTTPLENIIFTQPGMRYCQAQALVYVLMKEVIFERYSAREKKWVTDKILEDVRGRMLEEIVLLETVKVLPKHKKACKLLFSTGEFDMVVYDTEEVTCEIFEVKHTDRITPNQYRHLIDEEKCRKTEHEFGPIQAKTVLYRGEDTVVEGISYKNVIAYLENLV